MRRILLLSLFIPVFAFTGAAAASGTTIDLVGFSTPQAVVGKLITNWQKTSAGKGVNFTQSYGPSTSQAKAIIAGQPADIAFLSNGLDVDSIANAGLLTKSWSTKFPHGGIAANSVVAFVTRPGNPKHIHSWADLTKTGIQVITPDPFPSGGAKWNVLAAYGAQRRLGKSDKQATAYVKTLFQHVVSQDTSGRNATNTFLSGKGDVLLTYESEALAARQNGQNIQYVIPRQTMLIELPIAVLKSSPNKDVANKFIRFVKGSTAQDLFGQYGFRPVDKKIAAKYADKFPGRPGIFKIDDKYLGGWRNADKVWFDPSKGRMVKIEQAVGGPSSG